MNIKIGDVIALDTDTDDEMVVLVEGVPKFKGKPGVIKGNKAIKISTVIPRPGAKPKDKIKKEETPLKASA